MTVNQNILVQYKKYLRNTSPVYDVFVQENKEIWVHLSFLKVYDFDNVDVIYTQVMLLREEEHRTDFTFFVIDILEMLLQQYPHKEFLYQGLYWDAIERRTVGKILRNRYHSK